MTVIKWPIQYHKWGLPIGIRHLRHFALEILRRKQPRRAYLGANWHQQLLQHHSDVKRVIARGLDRTHAALMQNADVFKDYFELYKSLQEEYQITDQDTYNIDEKGFLVGAIQHEQVIIPVSERDTFLRQDGLREWVSVLETISADGGCISSYIIFNGSTSSRAGFMRLTKTLQPLLLV